MCCCKASFSLIGEAGWGCDVKASTVIRMAQQHHHDNIPQHFWNYSCGEIQCLCPEQSSIEPEVQWSLYPGAVPSPEQQLQRTTGREHLIVGGPAFLESYLNSSKRVARQWLFKTRHYPETQSKHHYTSLPTWTAKRRDSSR